MDNIDHLKQRIIELEAEVIHWKANHADVVLRNSLIVSRPDIPIERSQYVNALVDKYNELKNTLKGGETLG